MSCSSNRVQPSPTPPALAEPDSVVCCASNASFKQLKASECLQSRGTILNWPEWLAENSCNPIPPSHICCFQVDLLRGSLKSVREASRRDCERAAFYPLSWESAPSCLRGNPVDNYPTGVCLNGKYWSAKPRVDFMRHTTRLFMFTGAVVLVLVLLTCCFFSIIILVRSLCMARRRRGSHPHQRLSASTEFNATQAGFDPLTNAISRDHVPVDNANRSHIDVAAHTGSLVVVVMPDSTVRLGQESLATLSAVGSPVSAAIKGGVDGNSEVAEGQEGMHVQPDATDEDTSAFVSAPQSDSGEDQTSTQDPVGVEHPETY